MEDPGTSGRTPAPDLDFWAVFESAPDAYLLLAPDPPRFTMLAANDARLRVTMTRRENVVGRPLFEVFPDDPSDPDATGVRNLRASLDEVLRTGEPHRMPLQKYDIRTPEGEFEERYWDPLNSPVFDEGGNLVYIVHRVEDVTEQVHARREARATAVRLTRERSARAEEARAREEVEAILERLRESEERYRLLADMIPQHIWTTDPEGYHGYFSRRWYDFTGAETEDTEGEGWLDFLHPDDVERTIERWQRSLRTGEPYSIEYRFRRADGEYCWFLGQAMPLRDESGGIVEWFGTLTDISERKRVEERLRDSEERFRALAENSTAAIFVIDEESTIEFANPAVERIFGYTREEMLGRSLEMLMPEDQRSHHESGMRRYLETGRRNVRWEGVELPGLTKDGCVVPLEISFGEFVRDGRHYFTGIARDITERKKAEEAMRESEERFRTLGNSIPQLAWMADSDGWIFWYNDRWHEYTGTTLGEMEGWGWRNVHHPDHVDRVVERIRHAFETGTPWEDTFPLRSRTGEYRWFLSRALPIRDASGRIVRWFGTNTDVTEEREAAAERERLLEREREARADADRRREELERVTESRTRLMHGFTHDVKNPLGAADGYAELLQEGVVGELSPKQLESVRGIRRSIDTSLHLIQELLELARAEAGQIELEPVPTSAAELAREAAEDFRAKATAAGLELEVHVPDALPTETDPARVRQVLGNLLSNAVKYTPDGRVTVEADSGTDGSGPPDGDWIAIRVSDTGPGIPEEKREAIFQEFTRIDREAEHGAGVGLAISRRIARLLGGEITLESEVGRGSTFTLWLPRTSSS